MAFGDMRPTSSQSEGQIERNSYSVGDLRSDEQKFRDGIHQVAPRLLYGPPSPAGRAIARIIDYHLQHGMDHLRTVSYRHHRSDHCDSIFYEFVPATWRFFVPVFKSGKHAWTSELELVAETMYKVAPGNEWLTGSQIKERQCKAADYEQRSIGHRLFATHGFHRQDWIEGHKRT